MDGCHLKGPFGGIALVAISLDANLQFFPIGDKHTWAWFIRMLRDMICKSDLGLLFMIDRR